ncbi:MAG: polyprenyl diphosphate synthase [Planctomycetia bacterium]
MSTEAAKNPGGARHVAIIMDGNGRWAQGRGFGRVRGHRAGVESVRAATRQSARIGLQQLTLFAFSTENWKRPADEVATLMRLLREYLVDERGELMENKIRLTSIGKVDALPVEVVEALRETERLTQANKGMVLCLALNYGARDELAEAARSLALDHAAGRIDVTRLSGADLEAALAARLYQPSMPPLDLMIRTAGELRLSNFLLWQVSYGELYVTDTCWPDFREDDLDAALACYATRVRRFGGLVTR